MSCCKWPGCVVDVPELARVCVDHWKALSKETRLRLSDLADDPTNKRLAVLAELALDHELVKMFEAQSTRGNADALSRWERLVRYVRTRDAARGRAAVVEKPAPAREPVQLRLVP